MFQNNLKIALRNLFKNKTQSTILISGLTIGMAACMLLLQYVNFELSYDDFYENGDNIYRVYQQDRSNMYLGSNYFAVTPAGLAPAMIDEYAEVKTATSIVERSVLLTVENSSF